MIIQSTSLPSLTNLRAFLAVAHLKNFTRAAEALGLTQTAVSHQIAQLEAFLGSPVFARTRPTIALTPLGRSLLPTVESSLTLLTDGISAAKRNTTSGRITIQTTPEFGAQWLAPRLEQFLEAHPSVSVNMMMGYRRADLRSHDVDAAIWLGTGEPDLIAHRLAVEEEFAVCAPSLAEKLPEKQAFWAAPLLRYSSDRHTVLDWQRWLVQIYGEVVLKGGLFSEHEDDQTNCFESFSDMLEACRLGKGFALVRSSLVADDLASGALVRPVSEVTTSDLHYHIVTGPIAALRAEVIVFRDWLIEIALLD